MKKQIIGFFLLTTVISFFTSCATASNKSSSLFKHRQPAEEKIKFNEVWAYVTQGRESFYSQELPVTDVCYFSADLNCYGELINSPVRSKLEIREDQRIHYVFICDSKSLTHFVLDPQFGLRDNVIRQIVDKALVFDGLNIDMELIPARDRNLYLDFLKILKEEWYLRGGTTKTGENKLFSVCVPGRVKPTAGEVFPYAEIGEIADRVFIMAYDEHWSTSTPGPIASSGWCRNIVDYAVTQIPSEKIIMGMPFYGRTWAEKSPSGAWIYSSLETLFAENKIETFGYDEDIPYFTYTARIPVTGYYNDSWALTSLCSMYRDAGINNVGFWRVGQETTDFWNYLEITPHCETNSFSIE